MVFSSARAAGGLATHAGLQNAPPLLFGLRLLQLSRLRCNSRFRLNLSIHSAVMELWSLSMFISSLFQTHTS